MNMKYVSKKKYILELTEAQIMWLEMILGRAFDGYFENNPRERKHCDNIYKKVEKALEVENK